MTSQTVSRAVSPTDSGERPGRRQAIRLVRAYVALTKPRIIELLLVTTVPPMVLARHGLPPVALVATTLAGGTLAAGSANTINCYLDRDIDAMMRRTASRPLAARATAGAGDAGPVSPGRALAFGLLLGVAGTVLLGLAVNWLAALLADAAILFYAFVYTLLLKRHTPANIVIGGAAGCFPVLVGWAAVTGRVGVPAILLAILVFLWTPPHFWALALKFRADYAAAGVPMLPVVAAPAVVGRKILTYTYLMVGVSLTLIPFAGALYGGIAGVVGAWFLIEAHRLRADLRAGTRSRPMKLFHASITYLTVLFAALAVSALL
jgi:protoheme IX farnesyltransferase